MNTKSIEAVLECGAEKACVIPQSQIVLSGEFRKICESNGCGNYGRCWMCPPDVGEIGELMEKVRTYSHGLLYQSIGKLEDSFDIEGMTEAGLKHAALSRRIEKTAVPTLPKGALHLTCGGCRFCDSCAKSENKPCPYPGEALASLESYGIDVYKTVKDTELKYINGQNTVTFFGMILFSKE